MIRAALISVAVASAAEAGDFAVPAGCTAYLTVQSRDCKVEHHWTCAGDPAGMKWQADIGPNGPTYIGKVDDEAQWIDSYFTGSGERETLVLPAKDPASLTDLFEQGLDSYHFTLNTPNGVHEVIGFDRIVERNLTIDGEVLHRTEYSIRITGPDGALTYASKGSEYVSETHRRFFSGYGKVTSPEPPYSYNSSPVEFIYPGQKGYLSNTPTYGCDVLSARLSSERTLP